MGRRIDIPDGERWSGTLVFGADGVSAYGCASACPGIVQRTHDGRRAGIGGDASGIRSEAACVSRGQSESGPEALDLGIVMGRDSGLDLTLVVLPGVSPDISLRVSLDGEGSRAEIGGLYLCPDSERVNFSLSVEHNAGHCVSRQLFRGIVAGRAATSFYGLIRVAPDAQKTDACQENHNLLLSSTAEARTRPQLEIYADDVKCSHGATVGRLSEEEQFYMRSRGIPEEEARRLQMVSFLSPVISLIGDEETRAAVSGRVVSCLGLF